MTPKPTGLTLEQLAERRTGLGGTDAAAVMGVSPWLSPLDVYMEKVEGALPSKEATERMLWGLLLEPALHERYKELSGRSRLRRVSTHSKTLRHKKLPWVIGHPDALDKDVVVDYKLAEFKRGEWGEPGTEDVPLYYKLQLWHYMLLTGRRTGVLYVLFGGAKAEEYVIPWTSEIEELGEEEGEWWNDHVVERVPPEPIGSGADAHALRRMYPAPVPGSIKVAMPYQHPLVADLVYARAEAKRWANEEERLKQQIQVAMGDAQELHAPGVKFTWKVDSPRVGWKEYAESLEKLVGQMVTGEDLTLEPLEEVSTLKSLYTRPGVRTFRTHVSKGPLMVVHSAVTGSDDEGETDAP